jgi:hypothetical protein
MNNNLRYLFSWLFKQQAADIENVCACHDRAGGSATPTSAAARAGVTAYHALTFELGQP